MRNSNHQLGLRRARFATLFLTASLWSCGEFAVRAATSFPAEDIEFFEQRIRPLLAERCYECHSAKAKKLKGGLYLDSKAGWLKGGDAGLPTIVPGKPDEGLFLRYVRHLEPDMEMAAISGLSMIPSEETNTPAAIASTCRPTA